jgi:hypothetical protein
MTDVATPKYARRRENSWENERAVDGVNRAHIQFYRVRMTFLLTNSSMP